MKNKMKKRVVKILTLVFCMVAVVTTTILPALAAWDESVYTSCIEEEYPVTTICVTTECDLEGFAGPMTIANGSGFGISFKVEVTGVTANCVCCNIAHEEITDYCSFLSGEDLWLETGGASSWNFWAEDGEIFLDYDYDGVTDGEGHGFFPMGDTDMDGYYGIRINITDNIELLPSVGCFTRYGLAYSQDTGGYHVFEETGTLAGGTLLKVDHWSTSVGNLVGDSVSYLEAFGALIVSHPRYSFAAGDDGGSYDSGYSAGYSDGYDEGYDEGYEDARIEFEPGTDTGAEDQYQNGYNDGYSAGYDTGYAEGTADSAGSSASGIQQGIQQSKFQAYQAFQILKGESPNDLTNLDALFAKEWAAIVGEHVDYGFIKGKDQGYGEGYYDGNKEAGGYSSAFKDVVFAIFEAPVNLVNGMLDFDLFGINVASLCKTLITVSVVAAIVTVLVKFVL